MEREAFAEAGGDGGGVGAAGAVRGDAGDKGRAEFRDFAAGEKQVGGDGAAQVAAFQKKRGAVARGEFRAGDAHFVEAGDGAAEERGGFVEIRRDERGEGKKALAAEVDGVGFEQRVAAGGDHDGIDDERDFAVSEKVADGGDDFAGVEHAGFDGGDGEGFETKADLLGDDARLNGLDGADFAGHFGDDAGDGGETVGAERAHGFQVGLRARARAVVGTGDGENGKHF